MHIDDTQLSDIAYLARLTFDKTELNNMTTDFNQILSYVEQLNEVDTDNITPMPHPLDIIQRLRADKADSENDRAGFQGIAPQIQQDMYVVPPVIE